MIFDSPWCFFGVSDNRRNKQLKDEILILCPSPAENTKLSQDNKEYHIKVIKIQSEKDAEHYENETLKVSV